MTYRLVRTLPLLISLVTARVDVDSAQAANCDSTSKGYTPLPQLAGTYHGYPGGLYPGGSNVAPPSHDSAGLALGLSFQPLDTLGQVDPNGYWVLLSVGMSNCTQEFSRFIQDLQGDTTLHPRLRIVDGAQGGQTASIIKYDTAAFWRVIETRLRSQGLGTRQVQAIWFKEANAGPTGGFPSAAIQLRDDLRDDARTMRQKFPNLKQVFVSCRTYAGYATTALNPEPYAYESGFAVRWLIESQIDGNDSLNFDSGSGAVNAAWMAWGPYLWTDGIIPRAGDSLQWLCADVVSTDGTHPSTSGRAKVSQLLIQFFESSPYAIPWFLKPTVNPGCACPCHADAQCDSVRSDILDLVKTIEVAFRGAPPVSDPNCPRERTDVDCSGATDVLDVVHVADVAFRAVSAQAAYCDPCGP
ncbi:MAG: hypothetical protein HY304_04620 [candidate division Zixibacteria bacterium]|nr:hypothetical protein [candidate division Zixibacteria bacterium]